MKGKERTRNEFRYIQPDVDMDDSECVYCGMPATGWDHAYPMSKLSILDLCFKGVKVPACVECNMVLGNKVHKTFEDREAYLKAGLRNKYRKILSVHWSRDELETLEGSLRKTIEADMNKKAEILERLDYECPMRGLSTVIKMDEDY